MKQHQRDLNRIHQSEIYGAAIFKTASILSLNLSKSRKWSSLYQLEIQTLRRLFEFLEQTSQQTKVSLVWRIKGFVEGVVLSLLPWKFSMKLLEKGTQDFQKTFLRLRNNSNEQDRQFYNYVYAHEKAIERFAQIEQNEGENSLKAVQKLLSEL
ncbi:MAG: hypothetical protein L3J83_11585 [Proteobacteria bacterium]|nr:hypothetical protein [Pseudomonadota bacterium]